MSRPGERPSRSGRQPTGLSDAELFRRTVGEVVPLRPNGRITPERQPGSALPLQRLRDERAALAASLNDDIDLERMLETDDALSFRRESVGPDVPRKLRRGHWAIRAQIDLHGLRSDEAREALILFLEDALQRHWRCVRIIHGKGLGSIGREPVLKRKVPRWLAQRREVLAFCQARPDDGGSGATIVLLR